MAIFKLHSFATAPIMRMGPFSAPDAMLPLKADRRRNPCIPEINTPSVRSINHD